MFNSLVFTRERNFEVMFGIFSVLVTQINVPNDLLTGLLGLYQELLHDQLIQTGSQEI